MDDTALARKFRRNFSRWAAMWPKCPQIVPKIFGETAGFLCHNIWGHFGDTSQMSCASACRASRCSKFSAYLSQHQRISCGGSHNSCGALRTSRFVANYLAFNTRISYQNTTRHNLAGRYPGQNPPSTSVVKSHRSQ